MRRPVDGQGCLAAQAGWDQDQALTQGAIKENDATKLGLHFASIMNLFFEGRT